MNGYSFHGHRKPMLKNPYTVHVLRFAVEAERCRDNGDWDGEAAFHSAWVRMSEREEFWNKAKAQMYSLTFDALQKRNVQ